MSAVSVEATVDEIVDDAFDGATTLSRTELAARLGVGRDVVRGAIRRGDLQVVRVSERRQVASRQAVRRWLLAQQDTR